MTTAHDLLALSRAELRALLQAGHPVEQSELADRRYRGISLGLPQWVERLTWKKFMKAFGRDPESGRVVGWNVRVEQDALDAPCTPRRRADGSLRSFGHFALLPRAGHEAAGQEPPGLLLHYGLGGNRLLDPLRCLRDPLVALRPGDPSLLLGWSYLQAGLAIPTPSFFCLQLEGPLDHWASPPRQAPEH